MHVCVWAFWRGQRGRAARALLRSRRPRRRRRRRSKRRRIILWISVTPTGRSVRVQDVGGLRSFATWPGAYIYVLYVQRTYTCVYACLLACSPACLLACAPRRRGARRRTRSTGDVGQARVLASFAVTPMQVICSPLSLFPCARWAAPRLRAFHRELASPTFFLFAFFLSFLSFFLSFLFACSLAFAQ